MSDTLNELFTLQSFGTFAGASGAVAVLTNTLRRLTGSTRLIWPLGFSLAVAITGALIADKFSGAVEWLVTALNACLLFLTATGGNEVLAASAAPSGPAQPRAKGGPTPWAGTWLER